MRKLVNGKILTMALSGVLDNNSDERDEILGNLSDRDIFRVERVSEFVLNDDAGRKQKVKRKETIISYPLDEYGMFETLVEWDNRENSVVQLPNAEYSLVLVAPDGRKLDCDFFDTTLLGRNGEDVKSLEEKVYSEAMSRFENRQDADALMAFVRMIKDNEVVR